MKVYINKVKIYYKTVLGKHQVFEKSHTNALC